MMIGFAVLANVRFISEPTGIVKEIRNQRIRFVMETEFVKSVWWAMETSFKLLFQQKEELPCETFAQVTGIHVRKGIW